MQYLPIYPPAVLEWMTPAAQAHFALGQKLIEDPVYRIQLAARRILAHGHFIVDNGAAEGESAPFADIVRVALKTDPRAIIVLPDTLFDAEATYAASLKATDTVQLLPEQRMVVPQGKSVAEWIDCFERMRLNFSFRWVGIAKHFEAYEGGRPEILRYMRQYSNYRLHMLGFYRRPLDEIYAAIDADNSFVVSWDSGAAISFAQNNAVITAPEWFSLDWDYTYQLADAPLYRKLIDINRAILDAAMEEIHDKLRY